MPGTPSSPSSISKVFPSKNASTLKTKPTSAAKRSGPGTWSALPGTGRWNQSTASHVTTLTVMNTWRSKVDPAGEPYTACLNQPRVITRCGTTKTP
jgi:hypothetical protein